MWVSDSVLLVDGEFFTLFLFVMDNDRDETLHRKLLGKGKALPVIIILSYVLCRVSIQVS